MMHENKFKKLLTEHNEGFKPFARYIWDNRGMLTQLAPTNDRNKFDEVIDLLNDKTGAVLDSDFLFKNRQEMYSVLFKKWNSDANL